MHDSCLDKAKTFVETYLGAYRDTPLRILDVGCMTTYPNQACHRPMMENPNWEYVGMDIEDGHNVDIVVNDPYDWKELDSDSFDVVLCNQVFEHIEYTWVSILEIARVLKRNGIAMIIAPSSGNVHQHPYDCWRYYPDGFAALAKYGRLHVLESHIQKLPVYHRGNVWRDASVVLQKPNGSDQEAAEQAGRHQLSKLLLAEHLDRDMLGGIDHGYQPSAASVIEPMDAGRDCMRNRELELLQASNTFMVKGKLIAGHLRDIVRTLRRPLTKP